MSLETVPKDFKQLRACLLCSLVKTTDQFEMDGCDNCESILHMKNNRDAVFDYTSANFDGLMALTSPEDSWVAKWQRLDKMVKGCYAVSVSGKLPNGVVRELRSRGYPYKSRDKSLSNP